MSDLNELIHTNATIAFNQGAQREQERIIKLLNADMCTGWKTQIPYCCDGACSAYNDAINIIKGEQK